MHFISCHAIDFYGQTIGAASIFWVSVPGNLEIILILCLFDALTIALATPFAEAFLVTL
jgi:hypothetical protein